MERWQRTIKSDAIRRFQPSDLRGARHVIESFVAHYNEVRLHSAIRYIAPAAKLAGQEEEILRERDRKLEAARERRRLRRRGSS